LKYQDLGDVIYIYVSKTESTEDLIEYFNLKVEEIRRED